MERIAVFPGSFDPITRGHESVIRRAAPLFDRLIVAIGQNSEKPYYFPLDQRAEWLKDVFAGEKNIMVDVYEGLTVDYCRKAGARYLVRGLRTSADFEFERSIARVNHSLFPGLDTVFMLAAHEYDALTSSIVREVHKHGGDISPFIPEKLIPYLLP
jgi:pantetheine-phosphate adenylyltransferase